MGLYVYLDKCIAKLHVANDDIIFHLSLDVFVGMFLGS